MNFICFLSAFIRVHLRVLSLLLLCAPALAAPPPATVKVTAQKVGKHSWYVRGLAGVPSSANQGYTANAGFVVTAAGVVVFDALGTPPLGDSLIRAIRSVTKQPIKRVVISHYHSDHFYGLQRFKALGAEVWAHRLVRDYLASDAPAARLEERRQSLWPWVDDSARVISPDRYLEDETEFEFGGLHFRIAHVGPAHTPEDLVMEVKEDGVSFVGDIIFAGRVPFVGDADSRAWIAAIDKILAGRPRVLVSGHGAVSTRAGDDLAMTRDYLLLLRRLMGAAVRDFVPFEEAYKAADWGRFAQLPAFEAANRINAYGTYILMERESLGAK